MHRPGRQHLVKEGLANLTRDASLLKYGIT